MLLLFVVVTALASAQAIGFGSGHRQIPSLTQPTHGSGECCGTSGTFLSGYTSGYGKGNSLNNQGYGNTGTLGYSAGGGSSRPIWTNVVPDYALGRQPGYSGYSRPYNGYGSNSYQPSTSPYLSGYNRPSQGLPGYPAVTGTGYGDYLSGGYGPFSGRGISWRR